ncbi:MAG: hypothetical protein ILA02_03860 [Clostridia bacterium]|nr:hypothetical protein [Clostridia bacterium]
MATFKDVLEESKLIQIAKDARKLLCDMENSPHWTETLEEGLQQYASAHSKIEVFAFKAALHFHIFWVCGEYLFETILLPVENLVKKIGACDLSQDNYRFKLVSMF